jgi:formamidopyrimidine-DNA glycosylase
MPELPEVETIKNGLTPHLENTIIQQIIVREPRLRWPIPTILQSCLNHQKIIQLSRRGKYLFIHLNTGTLIIHLGMSGSLRILTAESDPKPHDHVDFILTNQTLLRYRDPRRFGAILWTEDDPNVHPLIKDIGMEPLDDTFTGDYLHQQAFSRHAPIKSFIMNSKIVAGIGTIYATEALYLAKIHPTKPVNLITLSQYTQLVASIKLVLTKAITAGGTSLKDFVNSEGKPGYFSQQLTAYGRSGLPCLFCGNPLQTMTLGQRSTVFCQQCQE